MGFGYTLTDTRRSKTEPRIYAWSADEVCSSHSKKQAPHAGVDRFETLVALVARLESSGLSSENSTSVQIRLMGL